MRREQTEIITDMLRFIRSKQEVRPTHIMYKANLSHRQLKLYLDQLEKKKLITIREERNVTFIRITEDGLEFYRTLTELSALKDAFGIHE